MNKYQQKHKIKLSKKEKQQLIKLTSSGTAKARVIKRAWILIKADEGLKDSEIAQQLKVSIPTIERVRGHYDTEDLKRAVYDNPRSGQPARLDDVKEAKLVAIACSNPPEGSSVWTLELLKQRLIKDKTVKSIATVTIWHYLKDRGIKPWREKNVVHSQGHTSIH
jgi:transposase